MKTVHLIVGVTRNPTGQVISREPVKRAYKNYDRASRYAQRLNSKLGFTFDESGECTSDKVEGVFYEVEQVKLR